MRISDWSSDVCSSDLQCVGGVPVVAVVQGAGDDRDAELPLAGHRRDDVIVLAHPAAGGGEREVAVPGDLAAEAGAQVVVVVFRLVGELATRSEEHTSELPSLMRTSYAVFCLNKKKRSNK